MSTREDEEQEFRDAGMFTPAEVHCEVGIARTKARARAILPPGALLDSVLAGLDEFVIVRADGSRLAPDADESTPRRNGGG